MRYLDRTSSIPDAAVQGLTRSRPSIMEVLDLQTIFGEAVPGNPLLDRDDQNRGDQIISVHGVGGIVPHDYTRGGGGGTGVTRHGGLTELDVDQHLQYLNNSRGDNRYYQKSVHISTSSGVAQAGLPIVLDSEGELDDSMVPLNILGDLLVGDGSQADRFNISADTNILVCDSLADLGMTWATPAVVAATLDHGLLTGLNDADHNAVYYTETELDAGQLDNRYFTESEHLNVSAGAGDADKPIKLDVAGHIDASMINDGDIDHGSIGGLTDDDHVMYLRHDGSRALTGNMAFNEYKAIAMVCDNGATLPAGPTNGQWFLHTPTGRTILYMYDGSNWSPIISLGSMTVYVDGTDGTDDQDHGTAVDGNAFATIQFAVDQIPGLVGGNVIVNVNGEDYPEEVIIRGKNLSGDYTITLQGLMTDQVGTRNATAGTTTTVTVDGAALGTGAHSTQIVRLTAGTGAGQEAVILTNTSAAGASIITIIGQWSYTYPNHVVGGSSTPDATTDVVIETWATTVNRILLDTGQRGIILRRLDVDTASDNNGTVFVINHSEIQILGCKIQGGTSFERAVQIKAGSDCVIGSSFLQAGKNGTLTVISNSTFSCGGVWIYKNPTVWGSGCMVQSCSTGAFLSSRIDGMASGSNKNGLWVQWNSAIFVGWSAASGVILTGAAGGSSDLLCELGGGCANATNVNNTITTKTITAATYGWET